MAKDKLKTAKIVLNHIKDHQWGELIKKLDLTEEQIKSFFIHYEYASLELEIDEDLNVVSGKILLNITRRF